ncbi:MAG: GC-type dockerin domain-anchored protein [Phycisphaerales bacterium]
MPAFQIGALAIVSCGALAAAAHATPFESTTFPTHINSASTGNGAGGGQQPTNGTVVLNQTFAGGYTPLRIVLSGSLTSTATGTWRSDARIYVTPPAGHAPFTIQPFNGESFTTVAIPPNYSVNLAGGGYNPVGTWTYAFYEDYQDNPTGIDATWNNLVLTFDDQPAPPPTPPTAAADLGVLAASDVFTTNTVTTTVAGEVKWVTFAIPTHVTSVNNYFLDISTEGSALSDTYLVLFGGDGAPIVEDDEDGSGHLSQLSFGSGLRAAPALAQNYDGRDGQLLAGTYWLACCSYPPNGIGLPYQITGGDTTGDITVNVRYGQSPPVAAPTVFFNMGVLPTDGSFATRTVGLDAATVKWVRFTLPAAVNLATRTYLDIDTETSSVSAATVCLFKADGTIAGLDSYEGSGGMAQLSFGTGTRLPYGDSALYNGRDGESLLGGDYFMAVAVPETAFANGWLAISGAEEAGDVVVRIRHGVQPLPTAPTPNTDFGVLTPGVQSSTMALGPAEVKWFRMVLSSPVSNAAARFLDIDTENSVQDSGEDLDTYLAFFDNTGAVIVTDDESGSGHRSQLSFGQTSPTRPAVSTNGANPGSTYDGRNGDLAAGTYWVAAFGYPATYGTPDAGWLVASQSNLSGTLQLNVRTGTAPAHVPPTTLTDLGTLPFNGAFVTGSADFTTASPVFWCRFNLAAAVSRSGLTFLDVDAETSTVEGVGIALFDSTGALIGADGEDGSDAMGQLTYGRGPRLAPGNGLNYNGRDGETLGAGTYYIAATQHNEAFDNGWQAVTSRSNPGGTMVLRVRTGPYVPPAETYVKLSDGGETLATALECTGSGNLGTIMAQFTPDHTDLYKIQICDHISFRATTIGSTFADTQLFLFDSSGHGVTANDDEADTNSYRSTLTGLHIAADGIYYLAVCTFGREPVDSSHNMLWEDQPYEEERAPDGPGAANILSSWDGDAYSTAEYVVALSGACFVTSGPQPCNAADVSHLGGGGGADGINTVDDIVFFLTQFFAGNVAVADLVGLGGAPNPRDGQVTVDDLVYFLSQFFQPCSP